MTTLPLRLAFLAIVALLAVGAVLPAFALESPANLPIAGTFAAAESGGTDVMPMVVWSIVAVLVAGVVFGTLFLLKRRVGGFPANPTWVAPISVMPSKDFADEGTFSEAPQDSHH
jgi:hypothetical protein